MGLGGALGAAASLGGGVEGGTRGCFFDDQVVSSWVLLSSVRVRQRAWAILGSVATKCQA